MESFDTRSGFLVRYANGYTENLEKAEVASILLTKAPPQALNLTESNVVSDEITNCIQQLNDGTQPLASTETEMREETETDSLVAVGETDSLKYNGHLPTPGIPFAAFADPQWDHGSNRISRTRKSLALSVRRHQLDNVPAALSARNHQLKEDRKLPATSARPLPVEEEDFAGKISEEVWNNALHFADGDVNKASEYLDSEFGDNFESKGIVTEEVWNNALHFAEGDANKASEFVKSRFGDESEDLPMDFGDDDPTDDNDVPSSPTAEELLTACSDLLPEGIALGIDGNSGGAEVHCSDDNTRMAEGVHARAKELDMHNDDNTDKDRQQSSKPHGARPSSNKRKKRYKKRYDDDFYDDDFWYRLCHQFNDCLAERPGMKMAEFVRSEISGKRYYYDTFLKYWNEFQENSDAAHTVRNRQPIAKRNGRAICTCGCDQIYRFEEQGYTTDLLKVSHYNRQKNKCFTVQGFVGILQQNEQSQFEELIRRLVQGGYLKDNINRRLPPQSAYEKGGFIHNHSTVQRAIQEGRLTLPLKVVSNLRHLYNPHECDKYSTYHSLKNSSIGEGNEETTFAYEIRRIRGLSGDVAEEIRQHQTTRQNRGESRVPVNASQLANVGSPIARAMIIGERNDYHKSANEKVRKAKRHQQLVDLMRKTHVSATSQQTRELIDDLMFENPNALRGEARRDLVSKLRQPTNHPNHRPVPQDFERFYASNFIGHRPFCHCTLVKREDMIGGEEGVRTALLTKAEVQEVLHNDPSFYSMASANQIFATPSLTLALNHLRTEHKWNMVDPVTVALFSPDDKDLLQYPVLFRYTKMFAIFGKLKEKIPTAWARLRYDGSKHILEEYDMASEEARTASMEMEACSTRVIPENEATTDTANSNTLSSSEEEPRPRKRAKKTKPTNRSTDRQATKATSDTLSSSEEESRPRKRAKKTKPTNRSTTRRVTAATSTTNTLSDSEEEIRPRKRAKKTKKPQWEIASRVSKRFDCEDKFYEGEIRSYDAEQDYYHIVYKDGDKEDLETHEIEDQITKGHLIIHQSELDNADDSTSDNTPKAMSRKKSSKTCRSTEVQVSNEDESNTTDEEKTMPIVRKKNHKTHTRHHRGWSREEDKILVDSIKDLGKKWTAIAERLPGRSIEAVAQRGRHLVKEDRISIEESTSKESTTKAKRSFMYFSHEEDKILSDSVKELGNQWNAIAKRLPGRNPQSVLNRWRNYLAPSSSRKTVSTRKGKATTTNVSSTRKGKATTSDVSSTRKGKTTTAKESSINSANMTCCEEGCNKDHVKRGNISLNRCLPCHQKLGCIEDGCNRTRYQLYSRCEICFEKQVCIEDGCNETRAIGQTRCPTHHNKRRKEREQRCCVDGCNEKRARGSSRCPEHQRELEDMHQSASDR